MVQHPWAGSSGTLCHPLDLPEAAKQDWYWNSEQLLGEGRVAGVTRVISGGTQPACRKPTGREHRKLTFAFSLISHQSPSLAESSWNQRARKPNRTVPCRSDSPRHRAGWRRVERGPEMESSQHRKIGHSWVRIQSLLVYNFPTKPVSGAECSGPTSFPRIHAAWLFFRSTLLF